MKPISLYILTIVGVLVLVGGVSYMLVSSDQIGSGSPLGGVPVSYVIALIAAVVGGLMALGGTLRLVMRRN